MIYHYTDIDKLALILSSGNIRFNRLDRVDDVSESLVYSPYDLSKNLFVSCWTHDEIESIPLWNMYTKNLSGVRIEFPNSPFDYQPIQPIVGGPKAGKLLSPIPWDVMFNDKFIIANIVFEPHSFEKVVIYDDNFEVKYKDAVRFEQRENNTEVVIKLTELASYKHTVWSFQKEIRYVMFLLPSIKIPPAGLADPEFITSLSNHIIESVIQNAGVDVEYFDLKLNPAYLNNIKIRLGPHCTIADKLIVESLLDKYADNGVIEDSYLSGKIRKPLRG